MDRKAIILTFALCAGLLGWLYLNVQSTHIYKTWHTHLQDPATGNWLEPRQIIDLGKIINVTGEYVDRTTPVDRLYDLVFQSNSANAIQALHSYSQPQDLAMSGWPVSNQSRCGHELAWINQKLSENPNYQLVKGQLGLELSNLMDAFGKFESGASNGLRFWLGSEGDCARVALDRGRIKARYCVAKMRFGNWPTARDERVAPKSRISIGACLPETCDSSSIDQHRSEIDWLVKLQLPDFYKSNLVFEELYCLPDERSPLRQLSPGGRAFIIFVAGWAVIVMIATILYAAVTKQTEIKRARIKASSSPPPPPQPKLQNPLGKLLTVDLEQANSTASSETTSETSKKTKEKLISLFALQESWRDFVHDEFAKKRSEASEANLAIRVDMSSMNMLKVVATLLIVLAHCYYIGSLHVRSLGRRVEWTTTEMARFVMVIGVCVDTFFLLAGLLMSYNLVKRFRPDQLTSLRVWLGFQYSLMSRIALVYWLVFCYAKLIEPLTGSGPWWDYGTDDYSARGLCRRESWIRLIPHLGHVGEITNGACVAPAWFLVSYFQIALLIPLIVYCICKLPSRFAQLLLVAYLLSISVAQLALKMLKQTTLRGDEFSQYGGYLLVLLEKFEQTGTMAPLGRLGVVSLGCYVGYLLRMYELGEIKHWPCWLVSRVTLMIAVVLQLTAAGMPVIGYYLSKGSDHKSTIIEFLVGSTVTSFAWSISLSITLIATYTAYNQSAVVRFAGRSFWRSLNKVCLSIYLIHFMVLVHTLTSFDQAPPIGYHDHYDVWKNFAFNLLVTVPISFLVHFIFEAPMTRILKIFSG